MVGARRHPVGHALASDGSRFPIRIHLLQDPKSGFGQMARNGAGGDGRTAPGADAEVKPDDVPVQPSFQAVVFDDHVGGLDEGKLQILIGFFAKVAVVDLASGTGHPGGSAAIGGEGIRMGESGDIPDLTINDDDRKNVPNSRERLEQLDPGSLLDPLADPAFEGGDFTLDEIEQDELLLGTAF